MPESNFYRKQCSLWCIINNARIPLPLVLTGPASAQDHFALMDRFLTETLGPKVKNLYRIIIDDPEEVARYVVKGVREVRDYRRATEDAFYFNWHLRIPLDLQLPFAPTHKNMRTLRLTKDRPVNELVIAFEFFGPELFNFAGILSLPMTFARL